MRTRASQLLACSALFATSAWAELPPEPSRPAFVPFKESLTGFVEQFLGDKAFERWSPCKLCLYAFVGFAPSLMSGDLVLS